MTKGRKLLTTVVNRCSAGGAPVFTEISAKYNVSYRRVGARDTLIGGIKHAEGPFDTYDAAAEYAVAANSKPHTPFFFFVERSL